MSCSGQLKIYKWRLIKVNRKKKKRKEKKKKKRRRKERKNNKNKLKETRRIQIDIKRNN